jgi:DNA-binding NarL/FixJ family response regulator
LDTQTLRVLVVDDFKKFRQFVCSTLGKDPRLQVVGEASDGLEAVHKAQELQPDLIVLDLSLPTLNGLEAAQQIRKLAPQCKILFLSQEFSAELVQEALRSGAIGYVVKARAAIDLLAAVQAVLQGRQFISDGL